MAAEVRIELLANLPLRDETRLSLLLPERSCAELIVVNDFVAIAVHPVRKYLAVNEICDISVLLQGSEIGSLCLLSQITQDEDTVASLTNHQYAAYLALAPLSAVSTGSWVPFGYDALVIHRSEFWMYWKSRASSMLWGGFIPMDNPITLNLGRVSSERAYIDMYLGCRARTTRHQNCLELASLSSHLTERFLHLYHYLELDYDYEIVREIKLLDENDPRGLWEAMKSQQADTDRLYHVIKEYSNIATLEKFIVILQEYKASAIRIFYDFGKDSNPLKSQDAFELQFLNSLTVSQAEFNLIKKANFLADDFAGKATTYSLKIKKLVCYWIYRLRCSIAHNKLGEYYLNNADDMEFLSKFGEPLLCELVRFRMSR